MSGLQLFWSTDTILHHCLRGLTIILATRKRTTQEWPEEWFSWARSGDVPWVCYMTDTLINEILVYIDQILSGIADLSLKNWRAEIRTTAMRPLRRWWSR